MSNIRMLVVNDFDEATVALASGTAVPTLPVSNLQLYNNSRVFRALGTAFSLTGNFNGIAVLSAFVLWRHNITAAGKIRIELFAGANQTGTKVYDSGEVNALPQVALIDWQWQIEPIIASPFDSWDTKYSQFWFAAVFAASYRITVSDPLNTAGHLDVTRIYAGSHFEPDVNFSWSSQFAYATAETQQRTDDGGLFAQGKEIWRKSTFSFDYVSEAERPLLSKAIRHARLSKDWFISLYPETGGQKEIENSFACKFTALPPLTAAGYNKTTAPVSVEEC